jgi:hypothetical protein
LVILLIPFGEVPCTLAPIALHGKTMNIFEYGRPIKGSLKDLSSVL